VAPGFSLPPLGGTSPITLASFRGKPVIVNFFASWCRDCRAELGAMATVARAEQGKVAVVGVDSNESSEAAVTRLLAAAGATYPVAVDARATVASEYLVSALPISYFVDAGGRVVGTALGPQTESSLQRWVARLDSGR
jgi:cytochrome c biogenesis protein CcmG, thiol:disulfide interchange protein DsbE